MSHKYHVWLLVSPEMSEMIPITDDGLGPMEYFCEAKYVEAPTEEDARALIPYILTEWTEAARLDGVSPYAGVEVEKAICRHGNCTCALCGVCEECEAQRERESNIWHKICDELHSHENSHVWNEKYHEDRNLASELLTMVLERIRNERLPTP